jgi:hypothetical protein
VATAAAAVEAAEAEAAMVESVSAATASVPLCDGDKGEVGDSDGD